MLALHQIVIIIATPTATVLVFYLENYSILIIGSFFTALGPLIFMFGGNYGTTSVYVTMIGIGEAIYAPRTLDYTIQVASKGR